MSGVGQGPTAMVAFDRALAECGLRNLNLIALSSVVPPMARVEYSEDPSQAQVAVGDRAYVVLARSEASQAGASAYAGLGWALDRQLRGGIFLEAHGSTDAGVRQELSTGMSAMCADRSDEWEFSPPVMVVNGVDCPSEGVHVCVCVVALVGSSPWS